MSTYNAGRDNGMGQICKAVSITWIFWKFLMLSDFIKQTILSRQLKLDKAMHQYNHEKKLPGVKNPFCLKVPVTFRVNRKRVASCSVASGVLFSDIKCKVVFFWRSAGERTEFLSLRATISKTDFILICFWKRMTVRHFIGLF